LLPQTNLAESTRVTRREVLTMLPSPCFFSLESKRACIFGRRATSRIGRFVRIGSLYKSGGSFSVIGHLLFIVPPEICWNRKRLAAHRSSCHLNSEKLHVELIDDHTRKSSRV
ncbi:unnamed protein product, partial [Ectocarpus sp. 12 AP-2014]